MSKPRVWTSIAALIFGLGLAIVLQAFLGIVGVFVLLQRGVDASRLADSIQEWLMEPATFNLTILIGPSTFAVATILACWFSPTAWRERIRWKTPRTSWSLCLLAVVGSLLPAIVALQAADWLVKFLPWIPYDTSFEIFFKKITPFWALVFVVLIGVVPGISEELLFRGYMQSRLIQRFGVLGGIIGSSILFGLAHIMPPVILLATIIGVYLGYVAWKCDSIWPTIAAHILINSGVNALRMIDKFAQPPEWIQYATQGMIFVVASLSFALALWRLSLVPTPSPSWQPQEANPNFGQDY